MSTSITSTLKRGRPTVLNAVLTKRICESSREGSTLASAAVAEGISERTLFNWLDRGEAGDSAFVAFFLAVSRARESYKSRLLKIVNDAAERDARHAQWLLERRFPREYGVSGPREIAIPRPTSPDDSGALQDLLLRARAAGDQERVERLGWALAEVREHNDRLLRLVELLRTEAEGLLPPDQPVH